MHAFAGIIMTPKSLPLRNRMNRFCSYCGEWKSKAFCDGWKPVYIDEEENLHLDYMDDNDFLPVYCPTLGSYRVRDVINPYYGKVPVASMEKYPAELSILITPSDKVYFANDDDLQEILEEYRAKHPDWGIFVVNYHEL